MLASLHDLRALPLALGTMVSVAALALSQSGAQQGGAPDRRQEGKAPAAGAAATRPSPEAVKPPLELPSLLALSREITKLRRSVDYVGEVRMRSPEGAQRESLRRVPVVHLGGGLLAGPREDTLEPGMPSVLRLGKRLYRVRYLGADRRFSGYYRLRDRVHLDQLPRPRLSTPKQREKLGDLVLVVEGSSAKLRLLSTWRMSLPPVAVPPTRSGKDVIHKKDQAKVQRLASWKSLEFYKLSEGGVSESAVVLALDGSLIGLVCSPALEEDANPSANSMRSPAVLQVVVDPRLLLRLAMGLEAAMDKVPSPAPGLGVLLVSPAMQRGADARGFLVQELVAGGPGERAGVQALDRWLAINGKTLESFDQIRAILRGLEAGAKLEVRFRRGTAKSDTLWIRPD